MVSDRVAALAKEVLLTAAVHRVKVALSTILLTSVCFAGIGLIVQHFLVGAPLSVGQATPGNEQPGAREPAASPRGDRGRERTRRAAHSICVF